MQSTKRCVKHILSRLIIIVLILLLPSDLMVILLLRFCFIVPFVAANPCHGIIISTDNKQVIGWEHTFHARSVTSLI
jgi:hypothetical protein